LQPLNHPFYLQAAHSLDQKRMHLLLKSTELVYLQFEQEIAAFCSFLMRLAEELDK